MRATQRTRELPGGPAVWLRVRDAKVSGTRLPSGPVVWLRVRVAKDAVVSSDGGGESGGGESGGGNGGDGDGMFTHCLVPMATHARTCPRARGM